jgi:hypothetical protein
MSQPITGDIVQPKPDFSREDYLAKAIVSAFGELINNRINDLPHRFKAPEAFAYYMAEIEKSSGGTSNVSQFNIGWGPMPIVVQMMTRTRQHILELVFQGADGMRLFILEIEYGDAVQKAREVLLSWR